MSRPTEGDYKQAGQAIARKVREMEDAGRVPDKEAARELMDCIVQEFVGVMVRPLIRDMMAGMVDGLPPIKNADPLPER